MGMLWSEKASKRDALNVPCLSAPPPRSLVLIGTAVFRRCLAWNLTRSRVFSSHSQRNPINHLHENANIGTKILWKVGETGLQNGTKSWESGMKHSLVWQQIRNTSHSLRSALSEFTMMVTKVLQVAVKCSSSWQSINGVCLYFRMFVLIYLQTRFPVWSTS